MDKGSPLSSHISHLTQHTHFLWVSGSVLQPRFFFFFYSKTIRHMAFPARRFFFFFSTASVPSGHHWRFGVRSSLSSDALALARLLCSALLSYLSYSQASHVRTHEPTHHRAARKACRPKARGHEPGALSFVLFCFVLFCSVLFLDPVFISPLFVEGSDSGAWNGLAMGAAIWNFLCFWAVGAF